MSQPASTQTAIGRRSPVRMPPVRTTGGGAIAALTQDGGPLALATASGHSDTARATAVGSPRAGDRDTVAGARRDLTTSPMATAGALR